MQKDMASLIRDTAASAGERKVAAALLEGFPFQALATVEALATRAGVSGPTVLRYLSRLGFARFAEFQARVLAEIRRQAGSPLGALDTVQGNGAHPYQAALLRQAEALRRTAEAAVPAEFDAFVALLAHPRHRILCLGGRFSQNLSRRMSRQLAQVRADVAQLEPTPGFMHEPVLDMGARDVLVLFDYRRYQPDLLAFARLAREAGVRIALFTDAERSPIAGLAHAVLTAAEAAVSPFGSRLVATAQIETVVAAVLAQDRAAARKRLERIEDLRTRLETLTRQAEEGGAP